MKLLLQIILVLCPVIAFGAQQNLTWTFTCNGYEFQVSDDATPLIYSFKAGDSIVRNFSGKVTRIGNVIIQYDFSGRVNKIGNVVIRRNFGGHINQIGGMTLLFNYSGQHTGSRGTVGQC
jgi:hypothetical protein